MEGFVKQVDADALAKLIIALSCARRILIHERPIIDGSLGIERMPVVLHLNIDSFAILQPDEDVDDAALIPYVVEQQIRVRDCQIAHIFLAKACRQVDEMRDSAFAVFRCEYLFKEIVVADTYGDSVQR